MNKEAKKEIASILREWADDIEKNQEDEFSVELTQNPEPTYKKPNANMFDPPSRFPLGWVITQKALTITKKFNKPQHSMIENS